MNTLRTNDGENMLLVRSPQLSSKKLEPYIYLQTHLILVICWYVCEALTLLTGLENWSWRARGLMMTKDLGWNWNAGREATK